MALEQGAMPAGFAAMGHMFTAVEPTAEFRAAAAVDGMPEWASRSVLEIDGAVSGRMRILGQAARSIGLSASFWFRVCHPSTLRMVI